MWVPNGANKGSGFQISVSVYTNLVFGIQIYACVCVNIYWECVHAVELSLPAVSASSPSRGWPWRPPAHPPSLPRHGQSHQSIQSRQHNESPSFLETATDLQPIISLMGIMLWSQFDEKFSFTFIQGHQRSCFGEDPSHISRIDVWRARQTRINVICLTFKVFSSAMLSKESNLSEKRSSAWDPSIWMRRIF